MPNYPSHNGNKSVIEVNGVSLLNSPWGFVIGFPQDGSMDSGMSFDYVDKMMQVLDFLKHKKIIVAGSRK